MTARTIVDVCCIAIIASLVGGVCWQGGVYNHELDGRTKELYMLERENVELREAAMAHYEVMRRMEAAIDQLRIQRDDEKPDENTDEKPDEKPEKEATK